MGPDEVHALSPLLLWNWGLIDIQDLSLQSNLKRGCPAENAFSAGKPFIFSHLLGGGLTIMSGSLLLDEQ